MKHHSSGFTLIELLCIIFLLGMLAATAMPRYDDLSSDARRAALLSGGAAIQSAVAMVSSKARIKGLTADGLVHQVDLGGGQLVEVVGLNPSCSSNGIWKALSLSSSQYYVTAGGAGSLYCTLYPADAGAQHSPNCGVVYDVAAGSLWSPLTSGC